ncbi:MAG: DUF998 domain-containing protein [Cyclobacteriaceae bacterium]|jgi:hypothetical membrane protein|nr:DUF998 domain-containing protein [Flammeovirgaceae bacterium]
MTRKTYASIGLASAVLFWTTYLIMSYLRPEYQFLYKAVSELGSVDAPNKWIWNVLGYILPGILISIYSVGLFKDVSANQGNKWPLIGLAGSGLLMSLAGIFPGDFDNRQSLTMLLHSLGSFGSYVLFLVAAFTFPGRMAQSNYWKASGRPTLAFTWLSILFGSWPFLFPSMPAAGQRLVFLFYFAWIVYTAIKLWQRGEESVGNR